MTIKPTYEELKQRIKALEKRDNDRHISRKNQSISLLDSLVKSQKQFIQGEDRHKVFDGLLRSLLEYTNSEYGFIGEVFYENDGAAYQLSRAISTISWNADTRRYYAENWHDGLRFKSCDTLFGIVTKTRQVVIANDVAKDPRSVGVPTGHPAIKSFFGVPILHKDRIIGSFGLANRAGGYDLSLADELEPFVSTCSVIISALKLASEREEAELKLKESEERFRSIAENSGDGIALLGGEPTRIKYVNQAMTDIFGYTSEELYSMSIDKFMDILVPEHRTIAVERMQNRLAGKDVAKRFEYQVIRKNGDIGWIELYADSVDIGGKRCTLAGCRDITEHKKAERQALMLGAAIDQAPVGIALADENISIYYCNPEGLGLRGGKKTDLVNVSKDSFKNWQVFKLDGEPYEIEDLPLVRAIKYGETIREEFIVKHQDGTNHICDAVACPVFENESILGGIVIFLDITGRKRTEEALRKSKELLSETTRQIPAVLYQFYAREDGTRGLHYISERSESVAGLKADLDGFLDRFTELVIPEHREDFIESIEKSVNDISPWHYEGMLQKPTGERIWFSGHSVPQVRENEIVFNGIFQDISKRKQYEDDQEITLRLLQALHEENNLHGLIREITLLMRHWSGCEAVGIRLREGEDYPYFETQGFPPHFVEAERHLCALDSKGNFIRDSLGNPVLECMCGNVIQGRFNPDLPFFTKNGSFWTNSTTDLLASTSDADRQARTRNRCHGEGYESVALIPLSHGSQRIGLLQFNDPERNRFDDRKIALFERLASSLAIGLSQRVTALALYESEERYRSIMESMDDAVYICSPDFRIEFCNPAMVKLIGRDATGERCHKAIRGLNVICPKCAHEKVMGGENVTTETRFRDKDRIYHVSNSPIFHTDGSVSKLTIFRDVTETKKIEHRLMQAQKMESIGNLAGGIAHDFNNILFPIVGLSEMLLEEYSTDSPEYDSINEIFKAGQRGSRLVKQILTFSRQTEQQILPVRVQQPLKEAIKLSRSTIPANIKINQYIKNDCGLVMADPTQIHQVAMNLITNAYHAVEEKGGEISIRLQETQLSDEDVSRGSLASGRYAMLTVADTGKGIAPSVIGKIFEPYFTTKEQGKGTGLGLAVVHGIVKELDGDIRVQSELDKGTVFSIYLPLMEKAEGEKSGVPVGPSPTGNERILLVDDELPVLNLCQKMLERLGYSVTARIGSPDALKAFSASPNNFDLVITDMAMPNMTGEQMVKELIAIRSDIPTILCTGFSERIDKKKAEKIGIKDFLMKPIVRSEMAKTVRKVLDDAKGNA
jgi:PAS domain S-box-containing protein